MRQLVIADAHIGQGDDDVEVLSSQLERAVEVGLEEVVFLGDVCQYLIGMPAFWSTTVRRVLDLWRRLEARGIRVVVVEGNRDFFLDEPELASLVTATGRSFERDVSGRRVRYVHGDLVNQRDLQYRFWSRVSKSRPARWWARALPRRTAVEIVESMEARLARTNRRYRYVKPVDDLHREAATAWAEGVDLMLWGHFHTPWWCGHDQRLGVVVPAWLDFRVGLWLEDPDRGWWVDASLTRLWPLSTMSPCPPRRILTG